jgi:hypothetical protein
MPRPVDQPVLSAVEGANPQESCYARTYKVNSVNFFDLPLSFQHLGRCPHPPIRFLCIDFCVVHHIVICMIAVDGAVPVSDLTSLHDMRLTSLPTYERYRVHALWIGIRTARRSCGAGANILRSFCTNLLPAAATTWTTLQTTTQRERAGAKRSTIPCPTSLS